MEIRDTKDYSKMLSNLTWHQKKDRLDKVLDIRKFEIEMYWKRASYFWTFIAASFTAYGITTTNSNSDKFQLLAICLGIVFSLSFYLVNKGSKFWQENWEKHTDYCENEVIGRLYKVTIPVSSYWDMLIPTRRYSASVSRINIWLSAFIVVIWMLLLIDFCANHLYYIVRYDLYFTGLPITTFVFCLVLLFNTKSRLEESDADMVSR